MFAAAWVRNGYALVPALAALNPPPIALTSV
jgi:hypothetical protein